MDTPTGAVFSKDRLFRYRLWRRWDSSLPWLLVIGCNPSKANADTNDPTIIKVLNFAQKNGYGGILMGNLYAFCETDPETMKQQGLVQYLVGEDNHSHLEAMAHEAETIVFAFGTIAVRSWPASHGQSGPERLQFARVHAVNMMANMRTTGKPVKAFKITQQGYPYHPLYLPVTDEADWPVMNENLNFDGDDSEHTNDN
eukprot:GFUD01046536.1.p1 GENE.GFUD01046536.1~~GFUD01046536.1.p1  ORF type:complete len:199 (+),score=33.10 GFUD01046536.1:67-663(+)